MERVEDVTSHSAFRNGAQTIAALYDLKADPQKRDLFTFEENGERYGIPWLRCRAREELTRRGRGGTHTSYERATSRNFSYKIPPSGIRGA